MSWASDAWDAVSGWFGGSGGSSEPIGQNLDGSYMYGPSSGGGGGGSWFNDAYNWADRNWDKIGKGIDAGRKIGNLFDMNGARQGVRSDMNELYTQLAQQEDAYKQQMAAYNQQAAAGAAAARRKNEAAQRKAQAKALKIQKQFLEQMAANYQPYADAAKSLTPKMAQNYQQYLDTTALLNQYLTPTVNKTLTSAPTPMAAPQVMAQAYKGSSQPVSLPSLDEILKKGG